MSQPRKPNANRRFRVAIIMVATGLIAAASLAAVIISRQSALAAPYGLSQKRPLIFSDEFDGEALDPRKWNTCYDNYSIELEGCTNYGNNESEWYQASQVAQLDGKLVLTAQKAATEGTNSKGERQEYPYKSGMITTGRFLSQTPEKWSRSYGYYEARIKVPSGQAVWPAFWLSPVNYEWPPEIDIMEVLGDEPTKLLTTYHWKDVAGNPAKDSSGYQSPASLADGFHVYAVNWQPGRIDWYLDGKRVKQVTGDNVPTTPMQIILNVAVGGDLPGQPDATTPDTARMLIDYVRVYR